MNIQADFQNLKYNSSDINQHLQTLYDYASQCETVTEFGTRYGESTIAFLASHNLNNKPSRIISYDLKKQDKITTLENQFKCYKFIEQDTLQCEIDETDILFIDTLHVYYQLFNELKTHSVKVKKYILLHDTVTYGEIDEPLYSANAAVKMSDKIMSITGKQGLLQAIEDFFNNTEDGKNWKKLITYSYNNGLTVLKRNI